MAAVRKRAIDDAGEKIEGARKDWKSNHMTTGDLDAMSDEQVILSVEKDNVWPKPDYAALVENGMDVEAAAYVKIIRDRLATKPRDYFRFDPIKLRHEFVAMMGLLRDRLTACRTVNDVRGVYSSLQAELGGFRQTDPNYLKYISVFKNNRCPFAIDVYADPAKVRKLLKEGFPGKQPAWKKGVTVRTSSDGTYFVARNGRVLAHSLPDEEAAWNWAKENYVKPGKKMNDDGKHEPVRPHLDRVERSGLPFSLEGRNVSPEDFIETFGFRGVQFGLWLPDDERQRVLNMGYEACMDLAEVLGWEPEMLSLGGTLGIAFGARGKGGKAAAHYEPGERVINMTRLSGAGSLAHEYGHVLDHWTGSGTDARVSDIPSGSGWHSFAVNRKEVLAHRGSEVAEAWERVMNDITKSPMDKARKTEFINQRIAELEKDLARVQSDMEQWYALPVERRNKSYIGKALRWVEEQKGRISHRQRELAELENAPDGVHGFSKSDYYRNAEMLCKSSDYWKRPNELFARAFEAWVQDEIAERKGLSQYLVHGTDATLFASDEYRGNPYPVGEERERINAAMRELARAMAPEAELALRSTKKPSL